MGRNDDNILLRKGLVYSYLEGREVAPLRVRYIIRSVIDFIEECIEEGAAFGIEDGNIFSLHDVKGQFEPDYIHSLTFEGGPQSRRTDDMPTTISTAEIYCGAKEGQVDSVFGFCIYGRERWAAGMARNRIGAG